MKSLLKKTLPISFLLLNGCAYHPGFIPFRPHYLSSIDLRIGSGVYHDQRHYHNSLGYYYKRSPVFSGYYDYHSNDKHWGGRHNRKRQYNGYKFNRGEHHNHHSRSDRRDKKHAWGYRWRDR